MVWARVGEKIEEALDSITFEHLLTRNRGKERDREHAHARKRQAAAGKGAC
jgi:DNA-binding IscR family transcriptional regulator